MSDVNNKSGSDRCAVCGKTGAHIHAPGERTVIESMLCGACGEKIALAVPSDDLPTGSFVHATGDTKRDCDLDGDHDASPFPGTVNDKALVGPPEDQRTHATTSAPWSENHHMDPEIPDPVLPDEDAEGWWKASRGWRMVGSAATEARLFWFWERR